MNSLFSLEEIKSILAAEVVGEIETGMSVSEVILDSRNCFEGSLFIPLKGEVTNGNLYIEGALKNGCRASLVERDFYSDNREKIAAFSSDYSTLFYIVDDGLKALHQLAAAHIKRFENLLTIGITGSCGKTTTKEVLGSIMKSDRPTLVTEGNYNSETGLPLTVFRIGPEHKCAVLEMGMSRPGEIKALVDIVNPDAGIITNIGTAHIGFFGTRDGIAAEKRSIFANFTGENSAVIPMWDDYYDYLKKDVKGNVVSVSENSGLISRVKDRGFDGWTFEYEGFEVNYPYMGHYNLLNALLAISCARELGASTGSIVKGLENLPSMFGRGEVLSGRNRVIRDCYNANPDSTVSSLKLLGKTQWDGVKVPIIGSMLELGDSSYEEHKKVARFAVDNFSKVILFGGEYEKVYERYRDNSGVYWFSSMDKLKSSIDEIVKPESLVLLKASRGVRLEDITDSLI